MQKIIDLLKMTRATLLLIVLGLIVVWFLNWKTGRQKDMISQLNSVIESQNQEVKVWKDKEGNSRARAMTAVVDRRTIEELSKQEGSHYSNLSKEFLELRKNLKNLNSHSSTHTKTIVEVNTILHDTVYIQADGTQVAAKRVYWKDDLGFNSFKGSLVDSVLFGEIEVNDSLEVVVYWKRKHKIIGKKIYHTEVKSKNPSTNIVNVSSIVLKDTK